MYPWSYYWRTKMVNNTVYQFVGSNLGLRYFRKRENIRKKVCWNKTLRLLFTLCIRVSRKFYLLLCFKLRYYTYTKWCKVFTKLNSWFRKSHEEFGERQRGSGKSKKLSFYALLLPKKYIPSARTLHTYDLSNITFNYLCENSPNYLSFLRPYIKNFSRISSSVFYLLKH